jgi:hypothetical protein
LPAPHTAKQLQHLRELSALNMRWSQSLIAEARLLLGETRRMLAELRVESPDTRRAEITESAAAASVVSPSLRRCSLREFSTPPAQRAHRRRDALSDRPALEIAGTEMSGIQSRNTRFFRGGEDPVKRARGESVRILRLVHESHIGAE